MDPKPARSRRKPAARPISGDEPEPGSLEALSIADLQEEIAMMRLVMRRVFEQAGRISSSDDPRAELLVWSRVLGTLGQAATRLAALLRTQRKLADDAGGVAEALSQALNEVLKEMEG